MEISCVSCQFLCELENIFIKATGRLIRCPECDFIFMVHRPSFAEEPVAQDTNIDQSILIDLYSIRPKPQDELAVDELFVESDEYDIPSLTSIEDFGEEAKKESNSNAEGTSLNDLPDLSEYEKRIDWKDKRPHRLKGIILF